jgi:hypothetical protein
MFSEIPFLPYCHRCTPVKKNDTMRILLCLILLLVYSETYCQNSNNAIQILTYSHGCHGKCEFLYEDSCGSNNDSIIESTKIVKIKETYYKNGQLLLKQQADSLNLIISDNIVIIKKLISDIKNERYLKFVPPWPKCYEFEEFKINHKGKIYRLKILINVGDGIANEIGNFLHGKEIVFYNDLIRTIK